MEMIKRLLLTTIICLFIFGCATLKPTIPAGCENSLIYKNAPWSFVMLTGAIDAAYIIYTQNPELYKKIQQAAREAEDTLNSSGIMTYERLSKVPNLTLLITSQLSLIFRPQDTIDTCDKRIILDYLKMI
jgi:hypothetical protein